MVSVLVPIFNVERYLAECLDSLLAQTYSDFEVLCIDDGSTDSSLSIVRRYMESDERFRVIQKPNSGYGASMNMGLDNALGTYIAVLESDDFFEMDALECMVAAAEANNAEAVKANFFLYWSKPTPRDEFFRIVDNQEAGRTLRPVDDLAIFFRKPSIWSGIYRSDFLKEHEIRFLETPGASYQDTGFGFKVWASADRVTFIEDAVLHYRQDNESSSINSVAKVFCICDEYASMASYIEERCAGSQRLQGILERMKFDSYMWNYERLSPELQAGFVRRISQEFRSDRDAGAIDWSLFEPWAKADLLLLMKDPDLFVERRSSGPSGKLDVLARCFEVGGPILAARALMFKLFKKSPRRINAVGGAA